MLNKRLFAGLLVVVLLCTGCRGLSRKGQIPYPPGWIIEPETEEESMEDTEKTSEAVDDETVNGEVTDSESTENMGQDETDDTVTGISGDSVDASVAFPIHYFLDLSGSVDRYAGLTRIHSAAEKAGAGHKCTYYICDSQNKIIEIGEEMPLSRQYGSWPVIEMIGEASIPVVPQGVNVLTTDLLSRKTASEIGTWLRETGCSGFSFYVFHMDYQGGIEFNIYNSDLDRKYVSVGGCHFVRDFLMIVFGDDNAVLEYDEAFQRKMTQEIESHYCHVTKEKVEEEENSLVKLLVSRYFTKNVSGVTVDNNRYLFGLKPVDTEDENFTLKNTFVFKKNNKSTSSNGNVKKVVLYGKPETELPSIAKKEITVFQYDPKVDGYVETEIEFSVFEEGFPDGLPVADTDDRNDKLGGNLVEDGSPAFVLTIRNDELPKGLYAVEVRLFFEEAGEAAKLGSFAKEFSADLDDYVDVWKKWSTQDKVSNSKSIAQYSLKNGAPDDIAFTRLLDFERLVDELLEGKIKNESEHAGITCRVIIDNR